jgi:UDP-N-acetylglucosamine 2-epimerase (non-hydrolysing)
MRESTERPETIDVGANRLCRPDPTDIVRSVSGMIGTDGTWENPFGDGTASERIVRELLYKEPIPS